MVGLNEVQKEQQKFPKIASYYRPQSCPVDSNVLTISMVCRFQCPTETNKFSKVPNYEA